MDRSDLSTPAEVLEAELVIIQAAGFSVRHRGFQKDLEGGGSHIYDILAPKLPGYIYSPDNGYPTLTLEGLKKLGLIE